MSDTAPTLLKLTDRAWHQVRTLLEQEKSEGLRLTVDTRGCNGKSYKLEAVHDVKPFDEKVSAGGATIYIDPLAVMFLIGTEMDWQENDFGAGFVFHNPNAKSQCGCGESFSV